MKLSASHTPAIFITFFLVDFVGQRRKWLAITAPYEVNYFECVTINNISLLKRGVRYDFSVAFNCNFALIQSQLSQ